MDQWIYGTDGAWPCGVAMSLGPGSWAGPATMRSDPSAGVVQFNPGCFHQAIQGNLNKYVALLAEMRAWLGKYIPSLENTVWIPPEAWATLTENFSWLRLPASSRILGN